MFYLFNKFTLVFLQLLLQSIHRLVGGLFKGLALLAGIQIVALKHQTDVRDLVLRRVGVVELQGHFGSDHFAELVTDFLHLLGDELLKVTTGLEMD